MSPLDLHRTIQLKIADEIGRDKIKIEHPFPRHFADLYWPEKKIIIEIQCTPISLHEAIRRTLDYENLGFDVVWILHQKSFNKATLTPTELYLRSRNALYTNIFTNNTGIIYDQDEVIAGHRRLFRSSPYPIDITMPEKLSLLTKCRKQMMIDALWRVGKSSIGFKGDRRQKDLKNLLKWLYIKNRVDPLYRKYEASEWAPVKIIAWFLKIFHLLVLKSGKNSGAGKENRKRLLR